MEVHFKFSISRGYCWLQTKELIIDSTERTEYAFIKGAWKDVDNITDSEKEEIKKFFPAEQELKKEVEALGSCLKANLRDGRIQ